MSYRPRIGIHQAIDELWAGAKRCPQCGLWFVYGRKGATFCSSRCAKNASQREYRRRHR